ncbi:MAG TPA: urea transporter [Fulvivirga sp.]|nr:urea transporter [Fulvivirga sp.]
MRYIQTILKGIGQVMFLNNSYSGLLFLIGFFYHSWLLGLVALSGSIISTGAAQILKYPKEEIENGIYGFNGVLIAIALWFYFGINSLTVPVLCVGAIFATPLMYYLKKLIPPFTAPFVIITWIIIGVFILAFKVVLPISIAPKESTINLISASAHGFSQVFFLENRISGALFMLAVLVHSRGMAAYAIYASLLGFATGILLGESISSINSGLLGYNAILCGIALYGNKRSDFLWISLVIILSSLLFVGFSKIEIVILTAPFILATWIVLILKYYIKKFG